MASDVEQAQFQARVRLPSQFIRRRLGRYGGPFLAWIALSVPGLVVSEPVDGAYFESLIALLSIVTGLGLVGVVFALEDARNREHLLVSWQLGRRADRWLAVSVFLWALVCCIAVVLSLVGAAAAESERTLAAAAGISTALVVAFGVLLGADLVTSTRASVVTDGLYRALTVGGVTTEGNSADVQGGAETLDARSVAVVKKATEMAKLDLRQQRPDDFAIRCEMLADIACDNSPLALVAADSLGLLLIRALDNRDAAVVASKCLGRVINERGADESDVVAEVRADVVQALRRLFSQQWPSSEVFKALAWAGTSGSVGSIQTEGIALVVEACLRMGWPDDILDEALELIPEFPPPIVLDQLQSLLESYTEHEVPEARCISVLRALSPERGAGRDLARYWASLSRHLPSLAMSNDLLAEVAQYPERIERQELDRSNQKAIALHVAVRAARDWHVAFKPNNHPLRASVMARLKSMRPWIEDATPDEVVEMLNQGLSLVRDAHLKSRISVSSPEMSIEDHLAGFRRALTRALAEADQRCVATYGFVAWIIRNIQGRSTAEAGGDTSTDWRIEHIFHEPSSGAWEPRFVTEGLATGVDQCHSQMEIMYSALRELEGRQVSLPGELQMAVALLATELALASPGTESCDDLGRYLGVLSPEAIGQSDLPARAQLVGKSITHAVESLKSERRGSNQQTFDMGEVTDQPEASALSLSSGLTLHEWLGWSERLELTTESDEYRERCIEGMAVVTELMRQTAVSLGNHLPRLAVHPPRIRRDVEMLEALRLREPDSEIISTFLSAMSEALDAVVAGAGLADPAMVARRSTSLLRRFGVLSDDRNPEGERVHNEASLTALRSLLELLLTVEHRDIVVLIEVLEHLFEQDPGSVEAALAESLTWANSPGRERMGEFFFRRMARSKLSHLVSGHHFQQVGVPLALRVLAVSPPTLESLSLELAVLDDEGRLAVMTEMLSSMGGRSFSPRKVESLLTLPLLGPSDLEAGRKASSEILIELLRRTLRRDSPDLKVAIDLLNRLAEVDPAQAREQAEAVRARSRELPHAGAVPYVDRNLARRAWYRSRGRQKRAS